PGAWLARCPVCGLLAPLASDRPHCPRCRAALHRRKPDSIVRCWALVITAAILYVPANLYPIMTVISFGAGAPDTILSGVKHLMQAGMWPLALLVFFASITVPVLKIGGLALLLVATQRGTRCRLRDLTRLYRIIEAVGRWSMIDLFMLSILVALVRFGAIASVAPGIGALSFAAVVVLTMVAATSFDPRLLWDEAGENW
ncbi:MAG: paraquat-inducible protein A, partial [Stellaceae bacterium]